MTKKIEEFFDLPPIEDMEFDECYTDIDSIEEKTKELKKELSLSQKIDNALVAVDGLESHEREMNDVSNKAMQSFEELMDLGKNTQDVHAGRIFENAAAMLDIALKARDSKISAKLKMIELQLKKQKLDRAGGSVDPNSSGSSSTGVEFDRNELLKLIKDSRDTDK